VLFNSDFVEGCQPLQINFTNQSNPQGVLTYLWDLGDGVTSNSSTTVTNVYEAAQCYDVSLTITANGFCTSTLSINDMICAYDLPVADFIYSPTALYSFDPTIQIVNTSINNDFNYWSFSDGGFSTDENPSYTFPSNIAGNYAIQLVVSTDFGCTDTTIQLVEVKENVIYYIPNTFTPDGDEHNNIFKPTITAGIDVNDYILKVFNRWGELIFESYDVQYGWDGTYNGEIVQQGTFVWELQFGLIDNDKDIKLNGHVSLIR
jgi:gliding motility-associated-like protein